MCSFLFPFEGKVLLISWFQVSSDGARHKLLPVPDRFSSRSYNLQRSEQLSTGSWRRECRVHRSARHRTSSWTGNAGPGFSRLVGKDLVGSKSVDTGRVHRGQGRQEHNGHKPRGWLQRGNARCLHWRWLHQGRRRSLKQHPVQDNSGAVPCGFQRRRTMHHPQQGRHHRVLQCRQERLPGCVQLVQRRCHQHLHLQLWW